MLSIRRGLGRTILVRADMPVGKGDVLRFHQELLAQLRRLGEPALLVTDLRPVAGLEPDTARMLQAMLSSPPLVARHVLLARPDTTGWDIAEADFAEHLDGTWVACASLEAALPILAGVATPAELHQVRSLDEHRSAA